MLNDNMYDIFKGAVLIAKRNKNLGLGGKYLMYVCFPISVDKITVLSY